MKRRTSAFLAATISLGLVQAAYGGDDFEAGKGGAPEYLFIEKVPENEAQAIANLLARAIVVGRVVIFQHLGKLHDAKVGDKGFTADYFESQWKEALAADLKDLTPAAKGVFDKLLSASRLSLDTNQERINMPGVGFKNFLPAVWGRETAMMFKAKTGISIRQPAFLYRNPINKPDAAEQQALLKARAAGDGKPFGEFATFGKQKVYRAYLPIAMDKGCLGCHGEPKGEADVLGYEKDGLKLGNVRALASVAIAVK
jgi:general secretion pathway protein A